jgi:hypothetical protein
VYARRVKGTVLDFSHRGWLYEESFLFYDYQTDSLWVQATGEAVHGPYKGTQLERVPSTQTTWKEWRTLHPQTRVLSRLLEQKFAYTHDSYTRYYNTGHGVKYQRYAPLHFGLAVVFPAAQKLYPFDVLEKHPVIADRLGTEPVLVVYHAATHTAVAFDPRYQGQLLTFGTPEVTADEVLLKDRQTGSTWSGLTGRCITGPAQGAQLRQWPSTQFVVENWPLHYPKGAVYAAP